jgi:hypothetical protein
LEDLLQGGMVQDGCMHPSRYQDRTHQGQVSPKAQLKDGMLFRAALEDVH